MHANDVDRDKEPRNTNSIPNDIEFSINVKNVTQKNVDNSLKELESSFLKFFIEYSISI